MRHKSWAHKQKRGAWGRELYQASDEKGDSWERCTSSGTKVRVPRLHRQRKRRGQNQKQKPERFRRTRSLLAQRAGEKRGEKMLRCGGILCVWTPNTMIMQMEKQKGRQSPFAKEKRESSLRYVKFEVHRLPNRTRSLRYYYVRLNHGGGNKARELETTVNSLIPLICILVNLASRRMSELRPSAEVSWCPTSIRGTKPTHLFFS